MVRNMSKSSHQSALQEIRGWTTEHVQKVLRDHGLGECCEAIRNRVVDGDLFLELTEGQLALWKRDLKVVNIKKLARFIQDVIEQPKRYLQADSFTVGHNNAAAASMPSGVVDSLDVHQACSDSGTRTRSISDSWDTDFSDDEEASKASSLASPVTAEGETEVEYCNSEILQKPPIPVRPPALALKPTFTASAPSDSHNLPKPPVPPESGCYGHVKSLVSTLNVPENTDQFDEEDYESLDKGVHAPNIDALAAQLKKSLEERVLAAAVPRPMPSAQAKRRTLETIPPRSRPVTKIPQHPSTLPLHANKSQAVQGHHSEECNSDEYESVKENEKPAQLLPGDGTEYYLQPVGQPADPRTGGPPPLPAKPWSKPADASLPSIKPPSPPRRKSDDSSCSPGNSGDGVTGRLGEFFRKLRSPAISSSQDSRERAPTPEVKKGPALPVSSHKPPSVEQRPITFQSTQRPLPPTPDDSKLPEKPTTAGSRKTLKVGLTQQPWYHSVDRKQAEEMLRNEEDGSFLVRPSAQSQNPLSLTLWYRRRLYNIGIRHRLDGRYALGTEKENEQSFASVEELVQNYQSEKLVLYSGGEKTGRTLLTTSPPH
ncbi:protein piccolo isoform X3 [Cryptotermes secundus]|uniref:protein piccolo isoform X3 n=1 Tax=Cryptotermes secundus TaxID=105785 RepID=UPI000CD7D339|nr:protein piccolo isoform X3 [Cryptotermes secundus]